MPMSRSSRSGSFARFTSIVLLAAALSVIQPRRGRAEDRLDFKYMYYQEQDDRMQVLTPCFLLESDLTPTLNIKIEGIYNSISGASPTGAPPSPQASPQSPASTQPYSEYVEEARENEDEDRAYEDDDEGDDEGEREERIRRARVDAAPVALSPFTRRLYHAKAGATPRPAPAPAPSSGNTTGGTPAGAPAAAPSSQPNLSGDVPVADASDERIAFNVDLTKKLDSHAVGGQVAYSTEEDYESIGLALRDSIELNRKNTTLQVGTAYTHDSIDAFARGTTETKDTLDVLVGVTQVLSPTTLFTVNLTLSTVDGFMDDPYKVVELNGVLVPEKRPDNKDKTVLFLGLSQYIKPANGSLELSYRYYDDTFGVGANAYTLAWYQKLGRHFILRPMFRLYQQDEADFYDVTFSGTPDFYSSDYRVSELDATSYGIKLVWLPNKALSVDVAYERYDEEGKDGVTSQDAYPTADIVTIGARLWF